jgi:hypothetical protein
VSTRRANASIALDVDAPAYLSRMDIEARQRRLDRARLWIHSEIAIGVVLSIGTWLFITASPGSCICTRLPYGPPLLWGVLPWVPVLMTVVGLAWMIRLSRPRVESGETSWRFRDF